MNLDPKIDMTLFLKPKQPDFSAQKFSAVWQNEGMIEGHEFVCGTVPVSVSVPLSAAKITTRMVHLGFCAEHPR